MNTLHGYGYDLPCEFEFLGCYARFHPEQFEAWHQHSLTHFGDSPPPPYAMCIFCDEKEGCFGIHNDRYLNWRKRMIHIGDHFQNFAQGSRLDHFVIEYMWARRLISEEDYKFAIQYTESPQLDGLLPPSDFEVPEQNMKKEEAPQQRHKLGNRNVRGRRRNAGSSAKIHTVSHTANILESR